MTEIDELNKQLAFFTELDFDNNVKIDKLESSLGLALKTLEYANSLIPRHAPYRSYKEHGWSKSAVKSIDDVIAKLKENKDE